MRMSGMQKLNLNVAKEEPHEKHLPPSTEGLQAKDLKKKKGKRQVSPWIWLTIRENLNQIVSIK